MYSSLAARSDCALLRSRRPVHVCAAPRRKPSPARASLVSLATEFYTAWGRADFPVLDRLVATDHVQVDAVWAVGQDGGRENLKAGIGRFTSIFQNSRMTVLTAAADEDKRQVLVHWKFEGDWEGQTTESTGLSILDFDQDNRVCKSQVYRQLTEPEKRMRQQQQNKD
ncbi:hypothetical protein WJX73_000796 [Symbiochloris irregularis]|uniref:SnoaL-like domain-containing protein n=1 Tax=Symbiochloris irregularis TaxID=706552 RepID=A0AAW1PI44_9CHLO